MDVIPSRKHKIRSGELREIKTDQWFGKLITNKINYQKYSVDIDI